jgi:phenylpropionate dioxygenase-like ring-hydroxylating dioxygenase large terminal subunit
MLPRGYDEALAHFGFENWHFFSSRTLEGPNWKIAYDGYMDFYHLPILHKEFVRREHVLAGDVSRVGPAPARQHAERGTRGRSGKRMDRSRAARRGVDDLSARVDRRIRRRRPRRDDQPAVSGETPAQSYTCRTI